jgi:endogenous inhibitor of DNA gyrase (YacG/DUF329 family)
MDFGAWASENFRVQVLPEPDEMDLDRTGLQ